MRYDPAFRRLRAVSRYSRAVRLMKIALPVAALATVAAIFVGGLRLGPDADLLAPEDIAVLGAGLALDNPRYSGRTEAGEPYVLSARRAVPDGTAPQEIDLDTPTAAFTLEDGRRLDGRADTGRLYRTDERLDLQGGVDIETSDGYRLKSERLLVDIATRGARVPVAVVITGPEGSIEAGSLRVPGDDAANGQRIFFEDGVRVVLLPEGGQNRPTPER